MGEKANKIRIANIDIISANVEVPWAIPKGVVWFTMQCRTAVAVRIGVEAGKAAASEKPYLTMKAGISWNELNLDIKERQKIFFAAASAVVVEIVLGINEEEEV